jgi:carbonic anhydrase
MNLNEIMDRNRAVAETVSKQDRSIVPRLRTVVLACADHRVDPAHVLGLDLGDAIVLRNPGGRVTDDVIQNLLVLATIAAVEEIQSEFEIVVMHHTDCGLSRLTGPEHVPLLAAFAGVDGSEVAALQVDDPILAVQHDVARLEALGVLSSQTLVGFVLDLETGRVHRHAGAAA